jgi:hypothetical protein
MIPKKLMDNYKSSFRRYQESASSASFKRYQESTLAARTNPTGRWYPQPATEDGRQIVELLIIRWNNANGRPAVERSSEATQFAHREYWESLQVIDVIRSAQPTGRAIPPPIPPRKPSLWKRVFTKKLPPRATRIENDDGLSSPRNRERLQIIEALATRWNKANGRPLGERSEAACEWANERYWNSWDALDAARDLNATGLIVQEDES